MSKRSLFWGNGSGKLGEAVYYRAGGEQRTRTYIKKIKNPRSYLQAVQRTKFNNMVSVYKALKSIVDSMFIAPKSSQSPYNAWMQENARRNLWVAGREQLGYSEGISSGFLMSNGSLTVPTDVSVMSFNDNITEVAPGTEKAIIAVDLPEFNINAASVPFKAWPSADEPAQIAINVGSQFYQMLVGESNPYNLPNEFTVAFITCEQGNAAPLYRVFAVKCSAESTDRLRQIYVPRNTEVIPEPSCIVLGSNAQIDGTPDSFVLPTSAEAATAISLPEVVFEDAATESRYGGAMFVAFRKDGKVNVTRSYMTYGGGLAEIAGDYTIDGEAGMSIINEYMTPSTNIVD